MYIKAFFAEKGGLTHVEVEPILWLRTKQIMAGIKLFGYSSNACVSTALARLPHTLSPLCKNLLTLNLLIFVLEERNDVLPNACGSGANSIVMHKANNGWN